MCFTNNISRSCATGILVLLGLLLSAPAPAFADQQDPGTMTNLFSSLRIFVPEEQTIMAEIVLPDLTGRIQAVQKQPGTIIFVTFWAAWCPDCRREMPAIERLYQRYKEKGLAIVAVNLMESPDIVLAFQKEYGLSFPVLLDQAGETARRFSLRSIPTTYLLNNKGVIIGRIDGARDWDGDESSQLFDLLLSDKSPAPSVDPEP